MVFLFRSLLLCCEASRWTYQPEVINIEVGNHHNLVPTLQSWYGQSLRLVMNYTEADCNPEQFMPSVFSYSEALSHPLGLPQQM
jgi:hypothetical protein